MSVESPSAVVFYISTHGMPLVQSNYVVGTNCCTHENIPQLCSATVAQLLELLPHVQRRCPQHSGPGFDSRLCHIAACHPHSFPLCSLSLILFLLQISHEMGGGGAKTFFISLMCYDFCLTFMDTNRHKQYCLELRSEHGILAHALDHGITKSNPDFW